MNMENVYTVREVLKHLKISRPTLYNLIKAEKITPVKLGKRTLFPESEINRFLDNLKNAKG